MRPTRTRMNRTPPKVLTIAGSDSGGASGIQADLKTFMALGAHGCSVVTALTAQNSVGTLEVSIPASSFIERQFEAVMTDIGADAAKTGMLADRATIEAVAGALERWPIERLVVDPVMAATSGARLLAEDAAGALRERMLPLAAIVTPNLPEAEALAGGAIASEAGMREAAEAILALGPGAVLMKGGHLAGARAARDFFFDGARAEWLEAPWIETPHTRGSGCTLSAAIAAYLARGEDLLEAVRRAKRFTHEAIARGYAIGSGPGALGHGTGERESNED